MKFYLSSYKLGNRTDLLKKIENKKLGYIPNALDFATDEERRMQSEQKDVVSLQELGFDIERIDLRDYFGKTDELRSKLESLGILWVRGGNCFVLRRAMFLSGFDKIIGDLINNNGLIYAGFSAGCCVLGPTLKGLELVDDKEIDPYNSNLILDGLNLLDFVFVPHFDSDHTESEDIMHIVERYRKEGINFKGVKDGEVLVLD